VRFKVRHHDQCGWIPIIGDRRVRLLVNQAGLYTVTIEVRGPEGAWQDISLRSDQDLGQHQATVCYRLRCTEQEARQFAWSK
jgi:hypothetical protein